VNGRVYLEMWCHFPGKTEFPSRNVQTAVTGTTDWTTMETVFFLTKGRNRMTSMPGNETALKEEKDFTGKEFHSLQQ